MDLIIEKLLNLDRGSNFTFRRNLEQNGLRKVGHGKSLNYNFNFDDGNISPDQLVVIGYDKDLDLNFEEWLVSYPQKDASELISVYAISIDHITKVLGPRYSTVKTSNGQIQVPTLNQPTKFTSLPFDRKDFPLAISVERNLILPTELLCQIYFPAGTNFMAVMSSIGSIFSPKTEEEISSSCTGRVTMPLILYTGRGKAGTEYSMATNELEAVIFAQQNYIKNENNQRSILAKRSVHHAQSFVDKYSKLLNP